jgi:hypothetical protein
MKKAKKVIGMEVESSRGWIYVLPHGDCRAMTLTPSNDRQRPILHSSLVLDFLCLCTNPPVEGGVKGVEQQLEVLMTPTFSPVDWFASSLLPPSPPSSPLPPPSIDGHLVWILNGNQK